ncbi:MAG: hypothetical protein DI626_05880 [Micavibrio aeruginosavorus]|uniref:SURF1-like protein n=1 Tax=Micavibrio aeruginosavorus TaxID=349221 RepID=A0A2W5BY66_9BACT|nr:MAG: hypothetical protein DI626_05880 [Micavibrio aeruginosavorus]
MKLPIGATFFTVTGVAILISLGTWQVQRLEWKNDIIQRLNEGYDRAASAPPIEQSQLDAWAAEEAPIGSGSIVGQLQRDKAILLGPKTEDGRIGYHLIVPVTLQDKHILLANIGWVSDLWKDNFEDRLSVLPQESILLSGAIHKPDWSSFASNNSPENDLWFRPDIAEIAKAKELENPYPYMMYVSHTEPELQDVKPHAERWLPRNKHMQYALFWYAMALCLAGVYGVYIYGRRDK